MTLVKFADGRIKILPGDRTEERLRALRNRYGRPEKTFRTRAGGEWLEIEDWSGSEPRSHRVAAPGQTQSARLSRKAAIFFASFGITTGALPNVEASRSPEGV